MMRLSKRRRAEMFGTNPNEADLVICMVRDLNTLIPGCFAWRQETRGIPKRTKTGWKVERNEMELGKADIAGVVNGYGFVIEAKMPGGYLKPHQREWLLDYMGRGHGRAAVCRSSMEAIEFVKVVAAGVNVQGSEI